MVFMMMMMMMMMIIIIIIIIIYTIKDIELISGRVSSYSWQGSGASPSNGYQEM
jgi:hypothetical protein